MIPDLDTFPVSWLADAELSLTIGRPERVGLSFFSTDAAAFDAFIAGIGLPPAARDDEQRLRAQFDLAPRHWVKLHHRAGERAGWSQYFAVHERNRYPITTLRLFARQHGATNVARLEPLLRPALERDDSTWIVTLKREQTPAEPRISVRVPRNVLPALMQAAVTERHLDPARAEQYLDWNRRLQADDAVFVTVDPLRGEVACLDFEHPAQGSLPAGWAEATAGVVPRYLKCRLGSGATRPEWVVYVPATAAS